MNPSSTHYHRNDTIKTLFDQMMLESWDITIDFDAYFKICAPKSCTYNVRENFVFAYVITMLISVFGGLSVTIRVLAPMVVQHLYRRCIQKAQTTVVETIDMSSSNHRILSWNERLRSLARKVFDRVIKFNVFSKTTMPIIDQIHCTRLYLVVLMAASIVLIIYSASVQVSQQVVTENPTPEQYEELYRSHRSTLSCPCQNVSIPRSVFVSAHGGLHRFCSSIFIHEDGFLRYWPMRFLNGTIDHNPPFYPHDFRKYGYNFLNFIKTTCELLSTVARHDIEAYLSESLFSSEPITETEFDQISLSDFLGVAVKVRYVDGYISIFTMITDSFRSFHRFPSTFNRNIKFCWVICNKIDSYHSL